MNFIPNMSMLIDGAISHHGGIIIDQIYPISNSNPGDVFINL